MGSETLTTSEESTKKIAGILASTGFKTKEIAEYFNAHDSGNGIFKKGKNDGLLEGEEIVRACTGFAQGLGIDEKIIEKLEDSIRDNLPDAISIKRITSIIEKSDLNNDGVTTLKELGFNPKELMQLADQVEELSK